MSNYIYSKCYGCISEHTFQITDPFLSIFFQFVSKVPTTVHVYRPFRQVLSYELTSTDLTAFFTYLSQAQVFTITSATSFQVVQIAESMEPKIQGRSSRPAMAIIPPTNLYKKEYFFALPPGNTLTHNVLVTIQKDKLSGLTLDGQQVDQSNWKEFPETDPVMVGRALVMYEGSYWLKHPDSPFGAVLYGSKPGMCTYAWPAGLCIPKVGYITIIPILKHLYA